MTWLGVKPMRRHQVLLVGLVFSLSSVAQTPWSERMSATAMSIWPIGSPGNWNYEQGLILRAVQTVWERNPSATYFNYIKGKTDYFVTNAGGINTYDVNSYTLDNIAQGRVLPFLYRQTGAAKYKLAADRLRAQFSSHPRTNDGGFWHKKTYPYQMWLDGLFMAGPFYAEYVSSYGPASDLEDVTKQFLLMDNHGKKDTTGLLYHGWDESKQMAWANPVSGCSPNVWGRAMGWCAMGLVDVLEILPAATPKRDSLLLMWKTMRKGIKNTQDDGNGLWYQVMDKGDSTGNFVEASASCMLVYAVAKAVRLGYSPKEDLSIAQKGFAGIVAQFVTVDLQGRVHLNGICPVAGLGGTPYRDGSYAYYVSTGTVQDDPKGVGAFILAAVEIERASSIQNTTGIDYPSISSQAVQIYPNPVQNDLYLTLEGEPELVELYDVEGQKVLETKGGHVSMEGLPFGMYLLKASLSNRNYQWKVVKR